MINYNYASNKKVFEKLIQPKGYFQSLYHIHSQSYYKSIFKYCCYCKTNISQQENSLNNDLINQHSNDYSHSVIIKAWIINLEDECFFRRLNFLMKKIEENTILIENLWLEEREITDNDNFNNVFPFDQPLDKSGVNLNSNSTSLCLYLSEYTESSYKTHFELKSLKDYIFDKWKDFNNSLREILLNKHNIYNWACKELKEDKDLDNNCVNHDLNRNYSKNNDVLFDDQEKFNAIFPFFIKNLIIERTKKHYLELLAIYNDLLKIIKYFHAEGKQ